MVHADDGWELELWIHSRLFVALDFFLYYMEYYYLLMMGVFLVCIVLGVGRDYYTLSWIL